jgi:TM2 domain-containing membrane protein YozV
MKKIVFCLFLTIASIAIVTNPIHAAFPVENSEVRNMKEPVTMEQKVDKPNSESSPSSPAAASKGKSQLVALLLCIFIGGIGIHRFYLGYTWQGIVQLLTLGGCGIWSLIDLIRIITGDLTPKDGDYETTL